MKLVDDWRDWWRWNSTHVAAIAAVLPGAWASLPPELKAQVPEGVMPYVAGVLFFAFLIARLRQQP